MTGPFSGRGRWEGKPGTEVGVNSCFVALIATESVSIAIPWLLLPPEVGVNRHGLRVISGWLQEEVSDFHGKLGAKGTNYIVKPRLLSGDTPGGELGLYLGEPDLRICGPEGWQFHADSCKGRSGGRSSRVFRHLESCVQLTFGITNVVYHNYMNDGNELSI